MTKTRDNDQKTKTKIKTKTTAITRYKRTRAVVCDEKFLSSFVVYWKRNQKIAKVLSNLR